MSAESDKKLHILFLSSWYPSVGKPDLGIFVKRHAQAVASIHNVTVLNAVADESMLKGEFRFDKREEGNLKEFTVYYGKSTSRIQLFRKFQNLNLLKSHFRLGLKKVVEWVGKPDLIHVHVPYPVGLIAVEFSKDLKIPFVLTEHWTGYQPEDGRYKASRTIKYVTQKTIRRASAILPVSVQLKEIMVKNGLTGNYIIVPNVVDTDLFKPAIQAPEKFRLIHVSSLDNAQKNVTELIRAFGEAKKKDPSLELVIVGSGNDEAAIRRFSNEQGLTKRGVEFVGSKRNSELVEEFQQSSALIMNSRYENQPVVILEAFSCGIPVISTRVGGIPELINSERGILVDSGNSGELVQAILNMKANYATFIQSKIRNFAVEQFSDKVIALQLNSIYRSVLANA
jgi:glycosyltransferase involved in cell wall biosynthesis